jgi:predicted  nucleic acid-binding Zn ribbon protein
MTQYLECPDCGKKWQVKSKYLDVSYAIKMRCEKCDFEHVWRQAFEPYLEMPIAARTQ